MMPAWKLWRRGERERLLAERPYLTPADRQRLIGRIAGRLDAILPARAGAVVGITWPIRGELDVRAWALAAAARHDLRLALPAVVEPATPLEWRAWSSGTRMERGFWNILVPAERDLLVPDIVLAPLVGFRAEGPYRLGYGGGYFDRTLAARDPRPIAIGVGLDAMEVPGFEPQPHDIPMDAVVTESRTILRPDGPLTSSPDRSSSS